MLLTILYGICALVAYQITTTISGLWRNIAKAKATGLPYYLAPMSPTNRLGQLVAPLILGLWKTLPRKYWEDVLPVLQVDWQFEQLFEPFVKLGDTFVLVSPGALVMYTANAEAIHQITSRREAFPKPTELYKLLSMYGENVVTTEGAEWKAHRKVTSTSFNEKNAALVFHETITQTYGLLKQWLGPDGKDRRTIKTIEDDTMTLMLHIIGYAGFGLRFLWSDQKLPADIDPRLAKYSALEPPSGHSLNFKDALAGTLHHIIPLVILPRWLMRVLPFQNIRSAIKSENNLLKYFDEFVKDKVEDTKEGKPEEGMNIMGMLVRTSYGDQAPASEKETKLTRLRDSEIIGNAFVMMVAGHETTANATHFTLLQLATNPDAQRLLQRDVDRIFEGADPKTWDYDQCVNPLMASYVGACMNETLRHMPPGVDIPKRVTPNQDQVLTLNGEKHVMPGGMRIGLVAVAVQYNPRYWPGKPSKITGADNDILDWVPERWYRKQIDGDSAEVEGAESEDFGGFAGPDTSAQLFRPVRGSYLPFSDGARSCLGRRIAQVEMVAVLSIIFQKYSIELAVDEWASDEEVEKMSKEEKTQLYAKAQAKARETLRGATSLITLKLHGNKFVPIRLVPRGQERFVDWAE
ncbi:putative Cytochrome P450 [Seiridium cardinale]